VDVFSVDLGMFGIKQQQVHFFIVRSIPTPDGRARPGQFRERVVDEFSLPSRERFVGMLAERYRSTTSRCPFR